MFFVIAFVAVAAVVIPAVQALRGFLASLPASNADFSPF